MSQQISLNVFYTFIYFLPPVWKTVHHHNYFKLFFLVKAQHSIKSSNFMTECQPPKLVWNSLPRKPWTR